jgi:hypothetical protein
MMRTSPYGSATLSSCERYRYMLARSWSGEFGSYALWIGLNPSTADGDTDDQTVCNMIRRTQRWGSPPDGGQPFVGMWLGNLYAWRATDPLKLLYVADPIGPNNDGYLRDMIERAQMVICAWGNGPFNIRQQPGHMARCRQVLGLITAAGKTPYMLHRLTSGHPRHPLYWPEDAPAKVFQGYDLHPSHKEKNDGDKSTGARAPEEDPRR